MGRDVSRYTTITRSLTSLFLNMLGEYDMEELESIGRYEGGFWFWSFQVLLGMVMLNMLLAIVMDAYGEVKADVGDAETIWVEAFQQWARWKGKRLGERVGLDHILKFILK